MGADTTKEIRGPETLPCERHCEVPKDMVVTGPVPRPRHAWTDVIVCPHCERAWLVLERPE